MDLGLGGKVAMVTGGGSGIGEAIALRLAEEGATVVAADLNGGNAKAAAAKAGPPAEGVALDISSWEQAKAVVEGIVERHGRLDMLVNCAGAWRIGPFMDAPPEDWAFEVNTNLLGTIHCTRAGPRPDGRPGRGQDREHLLGRGPGRGVPPGRLLRGKGGDHRLLQGGRARGGAGAAST